MPAYWQAAWAGGSSLPLTLSLLGTLQNPGEGDKHAHQLPHRYRICWPWRSSVIKCPPRKGILSESALAGFARGRLLAVPQGC